MSSHLSLCCKLVKSGLYLTQSDLCPHHKKTQPLLKRQLEMVDTNTVEDIDVLSICLRPVEDKQKSKARRSLMNCQK